MIKIEKHIYHCTYELKICEREANNKRGYYFRKQIEVGKRKLKTLKK